MHSSSAPRAPHHTLAYYVSTRGWALMQYGIMKYNTLQRGADRAGWAGPGAGRAEAGGKVKLIRRGGARPLQPDLVTAAGPGTSLQQRGDT